MGLISVSAKRSAEALYSIAEADGSAAEVSSELQRFVVMYAERELSDFFGSARVAADTKVQVLQTLLRHKFSALTVKFLSVLVTKGQLSLLGQITEAYDELQSSRAGQLKVTVYSSQQSKPELSETIKQQLQKLLGAKNVEVTEQVDAALLGGIKVRVGDALIDGSVQNRLRAMEANLTRKFG